MKKSIKQPINFSVSYGRMLYTPNGQVICHICGKAFNSLCKHISVHKIKASEYRKQFGLSGKQSLSSKEVIEKRRNALLEDGRIQHLSARNVFETGNTEGSIKPFQWRISQATKEPSDEARQKRSERGKRLHKMGTFANWGKATGYKKTKKERRKEAGETLPFWRQVAACLRELRANPKPEEELLLTYPKKAVRIALKLRVKELLEI